MSDPYLGEIRLFGGNFAPIGWQLCDGSLYSVVEYDALFNLIGTTYGGDGLATFAVPDLRGRVPIHLTTTYPIGARVGSESVTLVPQELPAHSHPFVTTTASANTGVPTNAVPANAGATSGVNLYFADKPKVPMSTQGVDPVGGNQAHSNMQPYLCINYIIAFEGIYPSQG